MFLLSGNIKKLCFFTLKAPPEMLDLFQTKGTPFCPWPCLPCPWSSLHSPLQICNINPRRRLWGRRKSADFLSEDEGLRGEARGIPQTWCHPIQTTQLPVPFLWGLISVLIFIQFDRSSLYLKSWTCNLFSHHFHESWIACRHTPLQIIHAFGNFMRIWSVYLMYFYLSRTGASPLGFIFTCLVPTSFIFLVLQKPWKGRPLSNSQVRLIDPL